MQKIIFIINYDILYYSHYLAYLSSYSKFVCQYNSPQEKNTQVNKTILSPAL